MQSTWEQIKCKIITQNEGEKLEWNIVEESNSSRKSISTVAMSVMNYNLNNVNQKLNQPNSLNRKIS